MNTVHQKSPGFPENKPDHTTFWYLQKHPINFGKETAVWNILQSQRDANGQETLIGAIQDAIFIPI